MYNTEKKMRTDILIVIVKSKVIELKVNWNIHRVIDCSLSNPSEILYRLLSNRVLVILQFLQDLLDSLFSILMQNTISDVYDNLVFDALVSTIVLYDEAYTV